MTEDSRNAHRRLLRNASSQIGGKGLYMITRLGLPPFILHHISIQEYGIWSTCFLLVSYISMGTFGIAGVYIRYSAEYFARGQLDKIGRLLGAGIWLTVGFSSVVLGGLWLAMPWVFRWFHIDVDHQDTAVILILGVVGAMLLDLMFPYAYVLQGIQRNAEQTTIWTLSYLLETVLIVVFLLQGMGLPGLMLAFVLRSVFALLVLLVWFKRILPGFKIYLFGLGNEQWRLFVRYGGVLQLIGIASTLLSTSERAMAGYVTKGVGAVGLLDIGQKFPLMASQLFNAAANSFLSAITHLHSLGHQQEVADMYLRTARYLSLLNALAMGFMVPFAEVLITSWIGKGIDFHAAALILVYTAIGSHVQTLTSPVTGYFQAIARPGRSLYTFVIPQTVLLVAGLAWVFWHNQQSLLMLVQVAMSARIASSIVVIIYGNWLMGVGQFEYFKKVLLVGMLPYLIGVLIERATSIYCPLAGLDRWQSLVLLLPLAAAYGLLTLLIVYSAFCSKEERAAVRGWFGKLSFRRTAS